MPVAPLPENLPNHPTVPPPPPGLAYRRRQIGYIPPTPEQSVAREAAKTLKKLQEAKSGQRFAGIAAKGSEARARQNAGLVKARMVRKMKEAQKRLVEEKVEQGLAITEEERLLLDFRAGRVAKSHRAHVMQNAADELLITPTSVNALRLKVESVAKQLNFDPIKNLMMLALDGETPREDKIGINKALLPFLVPPLRNAKEEKSTQSDGVTVQVQNFVFEDGDGKSAIPLHAQTPIQAETTQAPEAPRPPPTLPLTPPQPSTDEPTAPCSC